MKQYSRRVFYGRFVQRFSRLIKLVRMKDIERLQQEIARTFAARGNGAFRVGRGWYLHAGYETVKHGETYSWDGLKRGADAEHPYFIWQYTLAGCGGFSTATQTFEVPAGHAFVAVVPSSHRYFLPPTSPSWTYFWVTFRHDYITSRLRDCIGANGHIMQADSHSRLVARGLSLLEIWSRGRSDAWEEEGALFGFMLETERHWRARSYSDGERERWLEDARQYVLAHMERVVDVDELANKHAMSRSYYTHRFKDITGRSPALWMMQVRLEEATRRLVHTDQKLDAIARATGLQNANHLCKVFRRHFHLSPGEFRRQMK